MPHLAQSIESEIMDQIDLCDMIGSFASGTNPSMVAKIGTKDFSDLAQSIESEIMDGF